MSAHFGEVELSRLNSHHGFHSSDWGFGHELRHFGSGMAVQVSHSVRYPLSEAINDKHGLAPHPGGVFVHLVERVADGRT